MSAHWQRSWLKSKSNPLIFVTDVLGVTPEPWQAAALGKHDLSRSGLDMVSARPRYRRGWSCGSCALARTARCL